MRASWDEILSDIYPAVIYQGLLYAAHNSRPKRTAVNKTSKGPALWNASPWQIGKAMGETENKQADK